MKSQRNFFSAALGIALFSVFLYANVKAHDYLVESLDSIIKRSSVIIGGTVMEIRTGIVS
jgi:hypothetical protein